METFGHKIFILSQPVPVTGTGVLYPRLRDFFIYSRGLHLSRISEEEEKSRKRGYNTPVPIEGTGCDEMNIL